MSSDNRPAHEVDDQQLLKTLKNSGCELRDVLENSRDLLYKFNLKTGAYDYLSPSLEKLVGISVEDYIEGGIELVVSLLHPEDKVKMQKHFDHLLHRELEDDITPTLEYRIKHPTLGWRWFSDNRTVIYDETGTPVAIVGNIRDITEHHQAEESVRYRLELEKLENEISTAFVNAMATEIDKAIDSALDTIAKFAKANRSSLFIFSDDLETATNTHEYCANSEDSQISKLQNIPLSTFGWHRDELLAHNTIAISKLDDYPSDAKGEREWAEEHGFRSLLFIPLYRQDHLHGALGIYSEIGKEIAWPSEFADMLNTVGNLILNVLDRKKAEDELSLSEQRLELAHEAAGMGMFDWDILHDQAVCNDRYFGIFGLEPQERMLSEEDWLGMVHPDDRERAQGEIRDTFTNRTPYNTEYRVVWPDGSVKWVSSVAKVFFDSDGKPVRMIGAMTDIAERKRAEEALRESEKQLSRVYDTTGDVLFYLSVEPDNCYRFQSVNQSFLNTTGLKKEQVVGKRIDEVIPSETVEMVLGNYKKAIEKNEIVSWEEVSAFPTGVRIGEVSIAPVFDEKGNCTHLVGSVHDLTERKLAEEKLRESEELSRAVIDHSPVGVAVRSRTGKLLSYNQAWRDIWQVRDEDLDDYTNRDRDELKFDDRDNYLGEWLPKIKAIYEEGGYLYIPELEIKSARKIRNLWLSHHFYAIKDAKGNVDSVVTLTNDITKRKQTENMLRLAVEGTSAKTGEEFFQSLVQFLSQALGMQYGLIGETIPGDKEQVRTLAICADGKVVDNIVYDLAGTPCQNVIGKRACVYPSDIQALFPDDHLLVEMRAESYMGIPLVSSNGKPLGVLAVMDTKPSTDELQETAKNLLSILGARASAEIERVRAERILKDRDHILRESQRVASLGSYDLDLVGDVWTSSESLNAVLGLGPDYTKDFEGWRKVLHPEDRDDIITYFNEEVVTGHSSFDREYRIVRLSDGESRWVHGLGRLEYDSEGVATRMIGTIQDITERRHAETALRESSEIINRSPAVAFLWQNAEGWPVDYVSENVQDLFGYTAKDFMTGNVSYAEIIHPEDLNRVGKEVVRSSEDEEATDFVHEPYRIVTKSGQIRWIDDRTSIRRDIRGKITHYQGIILDITERRLAEEKLKSSERRSHAWLENSPVCTKVLDLDFNLQFMSAAGIEGLNIDDVTKLYGKPYPFDFYPNSFRNTMNDNLKKAKETGRTITQEAPVVDLDGKELWFHSTIVPVNDDEGRLDYVLVLSVETTERKRAEEAMQESNTRYEHLFSRMIDGFALHEIICDESGKPVDYRFLAMNPAYERMTGLKGADIIGKRAFEELPGLEPAWAEKFGAVALSGVAIHFEEYSVPLDKHFEITAYRPAAGQFATIFTDITETKRLRELESRAQRLETAGQIAGQVAHDFNNLLAPLMAYPEFIRDEIGADHSALQYLDDIENAAQQIADINQQLLTLGRRGHYNQEVINLNDVVSQATRQMDGPPSTMIVDTILDKELMNIKGGRSQIFRAISNLLVNAREAMQDIGRLTVKTENFYVDEMWINYSRVPQGEYVKLTISDTGCGVPDEIRLKIFEPFFTTKTADKKRGSGLGISVVDAVVKDHEGFVDLASKMGEGTSFFLYFPVTREVIEVPAQNELIGGGESVLIIDDDKVQRDVCTKLLTSLGYATTSVESGEEAIRLLGEQSFELLILDMIMPPGIDGAETYRQALITKPDQKAIIVSGFAESDRVAAALKMGAGAFVKKPLTRRRLATAVRDELDRVTESS